MSIEAVLRAAREWHRADQALRRYRTEIARPQGTEPNAQLRKQLEADLERWAQVLGAAVEQAEAG